MNELSLPTALSLQRTASMNQLQELNRVSQRFGLVLSEKAMIALCERREEALVSTDRVEFGEPVLGKIVHHFCDSPYIHQEIYEETIAELIDIFYYFKNEGMDMLSDDELLDYMEDEFNSQARGSLSYLKSTSLENLTRNIRGGHCLEEEDLNDYDPDQL